MINVSVENTRVQVKTALNVINQDIIRNPLIFASVQDGDWDNSSTWNVTADMVNFFPTPFYPTGVDTAYLREGHTITHRKKEAIGDIWVNNTEDKLRQDLNNFRLDVYGKVRWYTGTIDNPQAAAGGGASIPLLYYNMGGPNGEYRFVGESRDIFEVPFLNATRRQAGLRVHIDPGAGVQLNIQTVRFGTVEISSGEFFVINTGRLFLDNDGNSGGSPDADLLIRNGGMFSSGLNHRKTNSIPARNFVLDPGGIIAFDEDQSPGLSFDTYDFSGITKICNAEDPEQDFPQKFVLGTTPTVLPQTFDGEVELSGANPKKLAYDSTFNGGLSIASDTDMDTNANNLFYGATSNLKIFGGGTKVISDELPASGSGTAICDDLNLDATTYDLATMNVNIRGNLVGTGSTINGTLNQNQP